MESLVVVPRHLKHASSTGKNNLHQLGIRFNTVEVKEGHDNCHQSTLTITAEDADGAPYAWSGQEFKGEVVRKKMKAENAAARAFLADSAVQETAANMDPAHERQLSAKNLEPGRLRQESDGEEACNGKPPGSKSKSASPLEHVPRRAFTPYR